MDKKQSITVTELTEEERQRIFASGVAGGKTFPRLRQEMIKGGVPEDVVDSILRVVND